MQEKTIRRIKDNETGEAYPLEDDEARERLDKLEERVIELENIVAQLQAE